MKQVILFLLWTATGCGVIISAIEFRSPTWAGIFMGLNLVVSVIIHRWGGDRNE